MTAADGDCSVDVHFGILKGTDFLNTRYFSLLKLLMYSINYNFNYRQFYEYQGLWHGDVNTAQCRLIIKVMKGKFFEE